MVYILTLKIYRDMIMIKGFDFPFTHQSLPPLPNILDQRSLRLHLANVHYPR